MFTTELYVILIAAMFTGLGVWVGNRVTRGRTNDAFVSNAKAMQSLGISNREFEVLILLADGHSNKNIAKRLFVSPNTIKTHLAHLYEKLGVSSRTQAIHKSKALKLIP